jgi:hypothetical protein
VSAILILAAVLFGVVLAAVTLVQQLYQESLRLRPHERPALEYFKDRLASESIPTGACWPFRW